MPGFPFPGRPGGEHDEPLLDMIIARRALPPDAPEPMHDLARMLAALAGPAEPGELAGEAAVRAAFSRAASPAGISPAARRLGRRRGIRRSRRPARYRARLATALIVAAAGLGSVLAAYTDVLPGPVQQLAHVTVAAPAPPSPGRHSARASAHRTRSATPRPGSSPASGPAPSTGLAQPPGQGGSPKPSYKPLPTGSPGRRPTGVACGLVPQRWPNPPPKASAYPSLPSWFEGEKCTGIPSGPRAAPTLDPYVPLPGSGPRGGRA
jgi:hypothetical protein